MQRAFVLGQRFAQPVQIALVVSLAEETRFAIVAALDDVQRDLVKLDAGAAGNLRVIARDN